MKEAELRSRGCKVLIHAWIRSAVAAFVGFVVAREELENRAGCCFLPISSFLRSRGSPIDLHTALKMTPKHEKQEFVTVWVRDPKLQKEDFWHSYIDYEIFIHTNSMCFTIKTSCVRRRFREFVWLRQKLQSNAVLM
ncbi:sorting nexin-10 [Crotalus adamanteus]|uniref:Sorting nexin-10 n=1 Tax=Crotalus adamanteus TaxID=8729 RepID=A0AAW1B2Q0_CROAD